MSGWRRQVLGIALGLSAATGATAHDKSFSGITAQIKVIECLGVESPVDLRSGCQEFIAQMSASISHAIDDLPGLAFESSGLHLFDSETGNSFPVKKELKDG